VRTNSSQHYDNLAAGGASHVFRVRAHDNDQNQTSDVAIYRWIIN